MSAISTDINPLLDEFCQGVPNCPPTLQTLIAAPALKNYVM
jgi:hypothetical protein